MEGPKDNWLSSHRKWSVNEVEVLVVVPIGMPLVSC